MSETFYTPGVCNLNLPEIAYRKKVSNISLIVTAVLFVFMVVVKASPLFGLFIFLPLWIGYLNYLQAKNKFCVSYAASGVYNKSAEYAETGKVTDDASHKLDKAKARSMNLKGLSAGIIGTVVSVAILAALQSM